MKNMIRTRWVGSAAATALGLLLALLLGEVTLRLLWPAGALAPSHSDGFWLPRLQAQASAVLQADDMVPDADLGWRMKPAYEASGVRHDPLGFRGTKGLAPAPLPIRILAIGDSFAYGLGVRDGETFEALLEASPGVEVINAGVNGYGIDQAVLMWERHGRSLAPRVVVLTYYVDDFFRNGLSVREGPKPRFVLHEETGQVELLGPQESLRRATDAQASALAQLRLTEVARQAWHRLQLRLGVVDEDALRPLARTSRYLLDRLNRSVQASGARLVVMFIGHVHAGVAEHRWIEDEVLRSCRDLRIDCLDMVEEMAGPEWREHYLPNAHWSPRGHRAAAAALARHLVERGGPDFAALVPPSTARAR